MNPPLSAEGDAVESMASLDLGDSLRPVAVGAGRIEQVTIGPVTIEPDAIERPGIERPRIGSPGNERLGIERPKIDRSRSLVHGLRLVVDGPEAARYADAQVDDLAGRRRQDFLWRPPLALSVRARFSRPLDELHGTAGFGFWNDPWVIGRRLPAPPQALWFLLATPPSDMPLAAGVPGHGWKAAMIDVRWPVLAALASAVPFIVLGARFDSVFRRLWPRVQRSMRVEESMIEPTTLDEWHDYKIEWGEERVSWSIDGQVVFESEKAPRGPLGLVIWLDNQFMVATPRGGLRHGFVGWSGERALEIERATIVSLATR